MDTTLQVRRAAGEGKAKASRGEQSWTQLYACARALAIVRWQEKRQQPALCIAADMRAAHALCKELRFFSSPETPVILFPDWNLLPYDQLSPPIDIGAERMAALQKLSGMRSGICVSSANALLQRQITASYLREHSLVLRKGKRQGLGDLRRWLVAMGYENSPQVESLTQFAARGSLVDLWPPGCEAPVRVDFFDDQIDSMRYFDVSTQTSIRQFDELAVLPGRELIANSANIKNFRRRFRRQLSGDADEIFIDRQLNENRLPDGAEYYFPLFLDSTASLLDHLPARIRLFYATGLRERLNRQWDEINRRHKRAREQNSWPPLPPERHYFRAEEVIRRMNSCMRTRLSSFVAAADSGQRKMGSRRLPPLAALQDTGKPLANLERFIKRFRGRVLFVAETPAYREYLLDLLNQSSIQVKALAGWSAFLESSSPYCLCVGDIHEGAVLSDLSIAVIADSQLLGEKTRQNKSSLRAADAKYLIQNPKELEPGCAVIHEEYGVGRFLGLQIDTELTGHPAEFLVLEYRDGDKIYVPVSSLRLIRRYSGGHDEDPPLHKLGGKEWKKAKRKAAQKAYDVAAELLDTEARRKACESTALRINKTDYLLFSNQFEYRETPDQTQAITEVLAELRRTRPMDRMVCGDVGFGKTEVAMRAAFVAVNDGQQVAVLTPTTLLADQHYQTFSGRFAGWPVRVACLSRFRSPSAQRRIEKELLDGTLDIVIGTHKLLQDKIRFKRLGLIVIDEEQRFGVRHKERLKAMQASCHTLTLTATPIPRTLSMSLSGLREISIITTPPPRRCAIQSFVSEWDERLIAEACEREIQRGGQVYFIHNNIETIEAVSDYLRKLLPHAEIYSAHGRMNKSRLEKISLNFYRRRFSILVCTTIIENGIDVPSANTIVVNQADFMGLSQLHQLRGRVGRSHRKAYAYFLLSKPRGLLSEEALRRLEAIESLSGLGSGFAIASQDLEIRGAGELLGKEQSGHIHAIGFSLYNDLLKRAVQALRRGHTANVNQALNIAGDVDLGEPALIPENYVDDVSLRLILYRRIASMDSVAALDALQMEIVDRFGPLPDYAKNLFACAALHLRCQALGISRVDLHDNQGGIVFRQHAKINADALLRLINKTPHRYHFNGNHRLVIKHDWPDFNARYRGMKALIEKIAEKR